MGARSCWQLPGLPCTTPPGLPCTPPGLPCTTPPHPDKGGALPQLHTGDSGTDMSPWPWAYHPSTHPPLSCYPFLPLLCLHPQAAAPARNGNGTHVDVTGLQAALRLIFQVMQLYRPLNRLTGNLRPRAAQVAGRTGCQCARAPLPEAAHPGSNALLSGLSAGPPLLLPPASLAHNSLCGAPGSIPAS